MTITEIEEGFFLAAAFALFMLIGVQVFRGRTKGLFVCVLASAVAMIAGNIDKLASFSLSETGVRGELFQVHQVVGDATAATAQLRKVAALAGLAITQIEEYQGLIGGSNAAMRDLMTERTFHEMEEIHVDPTVLTDMQSARRNRDIFDYLSALSMRVSQYDLKAPTSFTWTKDFNTLPVSSRNGKSPSDIRALLSRYQVNDAVEDRILGDYEEYITTGRERRPNVWANRDIWDLEDFPPASPPLDKAAK